MIHLATLPASKMTQNKVGKFLIFENSPSLDLNCGKTGPNAPPNLLYIIRYMFELTKNHSLMR